MVAVVAVVTVVAVPVTSPVTLPAKSPENEPTKVVAVMIPDAHIHWFQYQHR